MLDVADYERIRRRVRIEGKTQRQAADELGHSRNTISKALTHSSPPGYRRKDPPPSSRLRSFSCPDRRLGRSGSVPIP